MASTLSVERAEITTRAVDLSSSAMQRSGVRSSPRPPNPRSSMSLPEVRGQGHNDEQRVHDDEEHAARLNHDWRQGAPAAGTQKKRCRLMVLPRPEREIPAKQPAREHHDDLVPRNRRIHQDLS